MNELETLLADLISINSINPDLVPGGAGEQACAEFISEWCARAGLDVTVREVQPGRPNVIAIARGTGGGKTLMLNGHMDVVGVAGMSAPFNPRLVDGKMSGRGACDMKCGLAAAMLATRNAKHAGLRGDIVFTAVMDEENAGLGSMDIAKHHRADAALVCEPTELELIVAHKGFVWLELETMGVAAHGSRADLGVDAICKMGRLLTEIENLDKRMRANPTHPLLKSGTVHASLIRGGQELSSYPASCVVSVERRTILGETPQMVEAEFNQIIARLAAQDPGFRAIARRGLDRAPMSADTDSELVRVICQQAQAVTGATPPLIGAGYWTDAATLSEAGIPAVLFGPCGAGAHGVDEWVDMRSVAQCVDIYTGVAKTLAA